MKKDLINIICEKEYFELTPAEKAEVSEFCDNEDTFNQMKDVFLAVEIMKFEEETPSAKVKESLDNLFVEKHRGTSTIWYSSVLSVVVPREKPMHRQPLAQIAAIAVITLLTFPLWKVSENKIEKVSFSEVQKEEFKETLLDQNKFQKDETEQDEIKAEDVQQDGKIAHFSGSNSNDKELSTTITLDIAKDEIFADSEIITVSAGTVAQPHSDFLFEGDIVTTSAYSVSAAEKPEILDLLTAAF